MRKLIGTFFVLTFFVQSCITEKRCNERYPPKESDSIRTWVTSDCYYVHDTILGGELLFDTSGVIPKVVEYHHFKKVGHLSQMVDIKDGKLTVICNEQAYIDSLKIARQTIHEKDSREKIVTVPLLDGWYAFWRSGFWILLFLVLLFIAGLFFVK